MSTKESTTPNDQLAIPALKADEFFIHTSPEMDALERAAADGKTRRHYENHNQETLVRTHRAPNATHFVRLALTSEDRVAGATDTFLEDLTDAQDADGALAFLYISSVLAPPPSATAAPPVRGEISFDDVIAKIGWDPRSTEERRKMHRKLYGFVQFCERAQVVGTRKGKYKDKHTGEEVTTQVRSSLWRIVGQEEPAQGSLYPESEVPVSVELAISSEWQRILTHPQFAQYLPMGEFLGMIPGNKQGGAWARVVGLALASFWRRHPREAMDGSLRPTRRDLLDRYPPKTGSVYEVLGANNAQRAIKYWHEALQILADKGFIEMEGEALLSVEQMRGALPRQEWAQRWLDGKVDIRPSLAMQDNLKGRVNALRVPETKKRGRPRKTTE